VTFLFIGLGGFAGAVARYAVDGWVAAATRGAFPWGTLTVNLSGSLVLGILFAASAERAVLPAEIRAPLLIGFLGSYTTFSTLALESWRLIEDGSVGLSVVNIAATSLLGLVAVVVGLSIGRAI
jgi:CrcB protein